MKKVIWVKPYRYTNVPKFCKAFELFGLRFTIRSTKTVRRRVGCKTSSNEIWALYEKLVLRQPFDKEWEDLN